MKKFVKVDQTIKEFMETRGFTLFTDIERKTSIFVAKFADAEDDITGLDKFIVFDDDLSCGEIWEFDPEARKDFTDDEIAQMIADGCDLPAFCTTSTSADTILFT